MRNILVALIFTLSSSAIASSSPKKLLRAMNIIKTAKSLDSVDMAASKRSELHRAQLILNSIEIKQLSEHQRTLLNDSLFKIEELHDTDTTTVGSCSYFEKIKQEHLNVANHKKDQGDLVSYYQSVQFLISMAKSKSSCHASKSWLRELSLLKLQS